MGTIDHKMKSITRFYLCNIEDHNKQKALGNIAGDNILESHMTMRQNSDVEMGTDSHIKKQIAQFRQKESKYSQSKNAKINVFTWNSSMGLDEINEDTVEDLLENSDTFKKNINILDCDVFVVGIQNVYTVNSSNIIGLGAHMEKLCKKWEGLFVEYFNNKGQDFIRVNSVFHEDVFIMVFSTRKMMQNITNVQLEGVKFSLVKQWSKKGAVIIKLDIFDTTICFINCHLTSDIDNTDYRVSDLNQIFKALDSPVPGKEPYINLDDDVIC